MGYRPCAPLLGSLFFGAGLLLWRSRERIFLDKVCISQADAHLKSAGIMSIGGFLKHSKRLLVLWDSSYNQRLWCIYELAAFLAMMQKDHSKELVFLPTFQGPLVFME